MKLLDVYTPELNTYVKYKVLDFTDVDMFVAQHLEDSKEEYTKSIIENVVFNLRSEVTESLKKMTKIAARAALDNIYNGCVMLNPGLDTDTWLKIAGSQLQAIPVEKTRRTKVRARPKKITKAHFLGLESYLKTKVIGQDQAIEEVVHALKRSQAGLSDENRPLGVFLFAGGSGVGKTHLAKELHKYLFDGDAELVRVDCGEYQHKHENQKLIGSPPGYLGYNEGGTLTNAVMKNPSTVVLLDEVEKAHPDLWNTFLKVFDEAMLTDSSGKTVSFKDCVIIMTTNLGNGKIVDQMLDRGMGFGSKEFVSNKDAKFPVRQMVERQSHEAIRKSFKPEFLNRIDKTVIFNHLTIEDLTKIVDLEMSTIDDKLMKRGLSLIYDDNTVKAMIAEGVNPIEGARGLSRIRRDKIEDKLSAIILSNARWPRGTIFEVTYEPESGYKIHARKPEKVAELIP